jgi:hypothetical protein
MPEKGTYPPIHERHAAVKHGRSAKKLKLDSEFLSSSVHPDYQCHDAPTSSIHQSKNNAKTSLELGEQVCKQQ